MNPAEVFERGLSNADALTAYERLVYLVQELEILADMEGWDHFFRHDYVYHFAALKEGLRRVGDMDSLALLEAYEQGLYQQGVPMEPDAIHTFLSAQSDVYFANDRDWREEFSRLIETRWNKIGLYLAAQNIKLISES